MSRLIVGISDQKLCRAPDELVTFALGSCVGICLYDAALKLAGMAHIMLPDSSTIPNDKNIYKFADTGIRHMYNEMLKNGANSAKLTAKIAGGATMFTVTTASLSIGDRNVESVKKCLAQLRIPIIAEDTGLNYGRTITFTPSDGMLLVSSSLKGVRTI